MRAAQYIDQVLDNPTAAQKLVDDTEKAILERLNFAESFEPYPSTKQREYPARCTRNGNSPAIISKFDYDYDFTDCYRYRSERDYLKDFLALPWLLGNPEYVTLTTQK